MSLEAGFTLIEALAAGLISTIVAGALLSVLYMTNAHIKDGSASLRLGRIQTVVSEQLRSSARRASFAKGPGEAGPFDDLTDDAALPNLKEILFCDGEFNPFARYRIDVNGGFLEEWDAAANAYVPFMVGNELVYLDAAASGFGILAARAGVDYTLACRINAGKIYTFPAIRNTVLHRNGK